jgi:hypothetical protein
VDDVDWGTNPNPPTRLLWKSYQQNHLVAYWEDLGVGNDGFCLQRSSFIFVEFSYVL